MNQIFKPDSGDVINNNKLDTGRRIYMLGLLCTSLAGTCLLFIAAFIWFQPDQFSLSDRLFPSPTVTYTQTPRPTLTPNVAATKKALQATSTLKAIQTTIANADSKWNILFSESFNSNENNWIVGEDVNESAAIIRKITNGTYKWEVFSEVGDFVYWITADTESVHDFQLTAEVENTKGKRMSTCGLVFRVDSHDNFYYFEIDKDSYAVEILFFDKWTTLIPWTESSAILPTSSNRLTVLAIGSNYTFLINGQVVANFTDDRLTRGTTGLAVGIAGSDLHTAFEFDNFEIKEP